MGAMAAAAGITSPARVRLTDLVATDGMPSENYKHAVAALSQSLRNFNAAIIQVPHADDVLLRCVLDSVRMFFHKKTAILQGASDSASEAASAAAAAAGAGIIGAEDPQSWNRTAGYYAEPQHARETYDFRPGRMIHNEAGAAAAASSVSSELPPAGLPEVFAVLGSASRTILDAIGSSLDLRSYWWTDLLDNVPLKAGEISTSVLSTCCQNRPGAHQSATTLAGEQAAALPIYEEEVDKGLLTLLKSDKPGLQIRDLQGRWMVVDADLGPQDMVLFTGLSLYQTTGGYLSPSLHRTDINTNLGQQAAQGSMPYGRCTVAFKLMPRASAILHCAAMSAAGHHLGGPFQQPVPVHEFMQRSHPTDQLVMSRPGVPTFSFSAPVEAAAVYQLPAATTQLKAAAMKRKKQVSRGKPLAPSKRLRLEAQRVLKERVQEIADNKGLKIRYCNLKECEEQHLNAMDSPCAAMRAEMEWPAGVPFVHPHDLPNKAKQAFLEAYEPGWTAAQDGDIQMIDQSGQAQQGQMLALTGAPHVEDQRFTVKMAVMEDQRFAVKTVYDFLRTKGKPVPTGKPQVVGHKVDISGLAKAAFEAGGRAQFEADAGFQRFIATHFQLDTAPERDKERALERLKKLYDQVLADYVEELVASSTQQVS